MQKCTFRCPGEYDSLHPFNGYEKPTSLKGREESLESLTKTIDVIQLQQNVFLFIWLTIFSFVLYAEEIHGDLFFLQINASGVNQSVALNSKWDFRREQSGMGSVALHLRRQEAHIYHGLF